MLHLGHFVVGSYLKSKWQKKGRFSAFFDIFEIKNVNLQKCCIKSDWILIKVIVCATIMKILAIISQKIQWCRLFHRKINISKKSYFFQAPKTRKNYDISKKKMLELSLVVLFLRKSQKSHILPEWKLALRLHWKKQLKNDHCDSRFYFRIISRTSKTRLQEDDQWINNCFLCDDKS